MLKFYGNRYSREQIVILQEVIEESINMAMTYSYDSKASRVVDDLTRLNNYLISLVGKPVENVENYYFICPVDKSVETVENRVKRKRKQLKKYLENQKPQGRMGDC